MRGKGILALRTKALNRITPAYAGKRVMVNQSRHAVQDHPRVCGEKHREQRATARGEGSPPRMRGKGPGHVPHGERERITPAYAGKRVSRASGFVPNSDHPRVCGEKRFSAVFHRAISGSPPRMRGKVRHVSTGFCHFGITPAYAGKRNMCTYSATEHGDHPRVCGEKTKKIP